MGKAYGIELRERVVEAIEKGMSKSQAHRTFKVSRSTIDDWLVLKAKTGSLAAQTKYQRGPTPVMADNAGNRSFIERHKHKTLEQMALAWQQEKGGKLLSRESLRTSLKRLGYSHKRNLSLA